MTSSNVRCLCLILMALLMTTVMRGQERLLNFKSFDRQSGIPDQNVMSMARDPLGFLWLGTQEGIYRFDGQRCQRFVRDEAPVGDAHIAWLFCDSHAWMWVATYAHGLIGYDVAADTLLHFRPGNDGYPLPNSRVKLMMEDRAGQLWVATHITGINLYDRASQSFTNYRPSHQFPTADARDIDEFTYVMTD
ncbi:MAG: two-component regulator propeller domain-containing protein, partial [Saprospiraceae bacterium]|nr:two-component regulator propeller domain-containing protein [Saprospiraceae bacterium]